MIEHEIKTIPGHKLKLGFRGEHVHFRHREYEYRPEDLPRLEELKAHIGEIKY